MTGRPGARIAALDIGGRTIAAAVCEAGGRVVAATSVATGRLDGAEVVLGRAVGVLGALLDAGAGPIEVLGVASIGVPRAGSTDLAATIPGWGALTLGTRVARSFGVPAIVVNDVKAAATAEAREGSLRGADPGLYVNLGTGLAMAAVVGGAVVEGARGAAGEIGSNLRTVDDVGRSGRRTLEDVVSGRALADAGARLDPPATSAAEVFARAGDEPAAAAVVDRAVDELTLRVVNLCIALDPARVAMGGGMARSWPALERRLRQALDLAVPFPPELVLGRFSDDAALRGALALAAGALSR